MHILDVGFKQKQIWCVFAVHLQAVLVVPFDDALQYFAIAKDDRHRSLRLHLLQVVKILGVGLFRRRGLFGTAPRLRRSLAFGFIKRGGASWASRLPRER